MEARLMHTGENGIAVIKAFESCLKPTGDGRFRTYRCPANVLTIGWGTTRDDAPDLKDGDIWTQGQCDVTFAGSLLKYERAVAKAIGGRDLNQDQFDALVSFVYNVGAGGMNGSVGAAVREGRDEDVPAALALWVRGGGQILPGLVRRRKAEGLLYAGRVAEAMKVAEVHVPGTMPQSRFPSDVPVARTTHDLQTSLNYLGDHLVVDGRTGPMTRAAVERFQASHGLHVDGVAGLLTWTAILDALKRKG